MSKSLDLLVKNIERYAAERPLSKVFKESDIPHSTLSRIMNKQTSPSLDTLDKIAKALEVSPADLFIDDIVFEVANKIPSDLVASLYGRPKLVYDTIRNLLNAIDQSDSKKKKGAS